MIFKEFDNPEEKDYDIRSSVDNNKSNNFNPYSEQLVSLIGVLEDVTEEDLQEQYGISMAEYFNPTGETIDKILDRINRRHK